MAKGKRAAALFEVIQASKEKEQLRAKGGGFLTPSWWFKGQSRANGNSKANGAAATPPPPAPRRRAFQKSPTGDARANCSGSPGAGSRASVDCRETRSRSRR